MYMCNEKYVYEIQSYGVEVGGGGFLWIVPFGDVLVDRLMIVTLLFN